MHLLKRLWFTLRAWCSRSALERDLDEELRHHIALETEANERRGLSTEEAARRARIAFGGFECVKEEAREAHGLGLVDDLSRDLRYAWRLLRREPVFTAAVILTLALGIGANTAVFSVVNAVLLRPLPFDHPGRLVLAWETDRASGTTREPASWPDFVDVKASSRSLEMLAAFTGTDATLTSPEREPRQVSVVAATHDLLPLLGVEPLLGRWFDPAEDRPGGRLVAAIGEEFWRTYFGASRAAIGARIELDGRAFTVAGVLPASSDLGIHQVHQRAAYGSLTTPERVQIWIPLQADEESFPRSRHPIFLLGRLGDGTSVDEAQRELAAIASRLEAAFPENRERGIFVEPFEEVVFGPVRTPLLLLLGAVGLVLVVATANVANLFLARSSTREREVALRIALGATDVRLSRQFLAESSTLTALGAVAGIALAGAVVGALSSLAPSDVPRLDTVTLDARVLGWTIALSVLVAVAFGLAPAVRAHLVSVAPALKSGARGNGAAGSGSPRRHFFRAALVVVQVSVAAVVMVGAVLLLQSMWNLLHVDPGFRAEGVLKASYALPEARYPRDFSAYPKWPRTHRLHDALVRQVQALPGVVSAAVAGAHPLDAGFTNSFVIEGREAEAATQPEIRVRQVSPGYLETVRLALVGGRNLEWTDDDRSPPVALINEAAVRRFFPGETPIGKRLRFWGISREIVGVVADERIQGLTRRSPPAVYVPLAQNPAWRASLLVRTSTSPLDLVPQVREILHGLDPELALYGVEPLSETLAASLAAPRFTAALLALFGAIALALACLGVQSLLSYTTKKRRPELGIRMALGASARQIRRLVVRDGLRLTATGLLIGLLVALVFSSWLDSQLFGISSRDPAAFLSVATLITAAALLASSLPARRATRTPPMAMLRAE